MEGGRTFREESAVRIARIPTSVVVPAVSVPAAFAVVLANVFAGERVGDAVEEVGKELVRDRRGDSRPTARGEKHRGAENQFASCGHGFLLSSV